MVASSGLCNNERDEIGQSKNPQRSVSCLSRYSSSGAERTWETSNPGTEWMVIKSWSGSGIKETETFSVSGNEWRISWNSRNEALHDAGIFQIYVKNAAGKIISTAANKQGVGADVFYVHSRPGRYYLMINSANVDWTVRVEAQPKE